MHSREILLVSPGRIDGEFLAELESAGWQATVAENLPCAMRLIAKVGYRVGLLFLSEADEPDCAAIDHFLSSHSEIEWVAAFSAGLLRRQEFRELIVERLFDHFTVPIDARRVVATLGHAYGRAMLSKDLRSGRTASDAEAMDIVGRSAAIRHLLRQVSRVAKVDAPALITGESGSGKELVAHAIHKSSHRAGGPFVIVNCGAIPAPLIQSELFGYEKGSFTGADRQRRGLIESANGGTVFLDEIGDLPLDMQTSLLRFLQERTIDRIGSSRDIHVDVRVIAATNVDLESAVATGAFRKDLYYRLNVLPLSVPPLRDRGDDIRLLAEYFFHQFCNDRSRKLKGFSKRSVEAMLSHDWPGNVRELVNRIRRAIVLAEGLFIAPADLGLQEPKEASTAPVALDEIRLDAERLAIAKSLQMAGKNVSHAAKQLRISRMTLYRLMAKHQIDG